MNGFARRAYLRLGPLHFSPKGTGAMAVVGCLFLIVLALLLWAATVLIEAAVLLWGWNSGVVPLFGAHPFTSFTQALAVVFVLNILVLALRSLFGSGSR